MFTIDPTLAAIIEEVVENAEGLIEYEQRTPAGLVEVFTAPEGWDVVVDGTRLGHWAL